MAIKFDLNTPLMASVNATNFVSATLSLFCMNSTVGTEKTSAYQITTDWVATEASWLYAKTGTNWKPGLDSASQGGGDTIISLGSTVYAAAQAWENYDVSKAIKAFLEGAANYGFLIIGDDRNGWTNYSPRLYASADFSVQPQYRPKITIKTTDTKISNALQQISLSDDITYSQTNAHLNLTVPFNNYQVTINNLKGQRLVSMKGTESTLNIPLVRLSTGIHLITIIQNNRNETFKVFVKK